MNSEQKKLVKKGIKILGKLVSLLSIVFIVRAVYVLGFDFSAVENWGIFLTVTLLCAIAKCITVYMSGNVWYGWLSFFSGKTNQRKETLCVYAKANIGKYLPGNVMHYVERNLFANKMGISQKKLAVSTVMEVFSLVTVAVVIAVVFSFRQLEQALSHILGENYLEIVLCVLAAGILVIAAAAFLFRKKLQVILQGYRMVDFVKTFLKNMVWYAVVLGTLGVIMVVLYCYMGGAFTMESAQLIISGYIIAWVLGFIVPGAPGGIGVRELVITLLLSSVVGEGLVVTLSVTHRLITIVGDFMAYLVMMIIRGREKHTQEDTPEQ